MKNKTSVVVFSVFFILIMQMVIIGCTPAENEPRNRLYVGFDLRLSPQEDARLYEPFIQYLSKKTGYDFRLRFTRSYEDNRENLGKGVIQFALMGPVSFIKAEKDHGAEMLVRGLNKDNRAEYRSMIFTGVNSDIKAIEDIRGRSFAFGSEDSTQGHLIPRKMLDEAGIALDDLSEYSYTGSHLKAVEAVLKGELDAGGAQDTLVRDIAEKGMIKIVSASKLYPSSGIVVNKEVAPEIKQQVKDALLALDPRGRHKKMLPDWDRTEMPNGFTDAKIEDYAELKELIVSYGLLGE